MSIGSSRIDNQGGAPSCEPKEEQRLDIITITIVFKYESESNVEYPEFTYSIAIHKLRDVQDIWNQTT